MIKQVGKIKSLEDIRIEYRNIFGTQSKEEESIVRILFEQLKVHGEQLNLILKEDGTVWMYFEDNKKE